MISRLTWSAVQGAAMYRVITQSWDSMNLRWNAAGDSTPMQSPYDFTVQPNTKYRQLLSSKSMMGVESAPVIKEFTTPADPNAPATPGNVTQETIP